MDSIQLIAFVIAFVAAFYGLWLALLKDTD